MKQVFIFQRGVTDEQIFNACSRDHCSDPLITLRSRMADAGYSLRCIGNSRVEEAEWVLFFDAPSVSVPSLALQAADRLLGRKVDWHPRDVYRECLHAGLRDRMALFLWEGAVVIPANWSPQLHSQFPLIFTWHDGYLQDKQFRIFRYPQPTRFPAIIKRPFGAKKLLVNISSNKASRHPQELYSVRRAAIRHFERARPEDFDLYGIGWDRPPGAASVIPSWPYRAYPSYRGTVEHKWDMFPRYRFALCYENNGGAPGYITEKIFDCMRSDCVPIYLGAPNVAQYIPPEAFIDRREFSSDAELERYLVAVSEAEYERYRRAIADFLHSERFAAFLEDAFAESVMSALGLALPSEQPTCQKGGRR